MARDEEEVEEKPEPAGGNKKLIIILAVSLVCVAAGVFFYLKSSKPAAEESSSSPKHTRSKRKVHTVIRGMEPFIVNLRDNSDVRYLKVKLEFEVVPEGKDGKAEGGKEGEGKEAKSELDPFLPQLKDSILMILTAKTVDEVKDTAGKDRLKQQIMSSASKILPEGMVTKVYFTDFMIQ
jgi:flagellar protein FliL